MAAKLPRNIPTQTHLPPTCSTEINAQPNLELQFALFVGVYFFLPKSQKQREGGEETKQPKKAGMLRFVERRRMEGRKHRVRCEGCPAFKSKQVVKTHPSLSHSPRATAACWLPPAGIPTAASGHPANLPLRFETRPRNVLPKA